jgi:proteasome lid subunit RPN8/RPN11
MPPVRLAAAAAAAIRSATLAALPLEACGLLFGMPGRVEAASVARNVAGAPRRRFEIDPRHLLAAHRAARNGGPAIIGCWHSHPGGEAIPSARDIVGITEPGWLWLIATSTTIAAWRPEGRGFQPVALVESTL